MVSSLLCIDLIEQPYLKKETRIADYPSFGSTKILIERYGHFVKQLLRFVISREYTVDSAHRYTALTLVRASVTKTLFPVSLTKELTMELSLEQQFNIRSFETQVEKMSREQAQEFLVQLYQQMIMRENMYKEFLKHEWGLGPNPMFES